MFEWYDFYLYGTLATIIGKKILYRPRSQLYQWLGSLLAFAAGFIVRPDRCFGCTGRLGETPVDRKYTFLVTIVIMGGSTAIVGFIPELQSDQYRRTGAADCLTYVTRLNAVANTAVQRPYVAEHAPRQAWPIHILDSSCNAWFVQIIFGDAWASYVMEDAFADWGWRISILGSSILLAISVWIRMSMNRISGVSRK